MMRGGVPITVGGQIVGAIGMSADTPDLAAIGGLLCQERD
jgi:uncharacterized protein GlcG (DUF336 family)